MNRGAVRGGAWHLDAPIGAFPTFLRVGAGQGVPDVVVAAVPYVEAVLARSLTRTASVAALNRFSLPPSGTSRSRTAAAARRRTRSRRQGARS